MPTPTNPEPVSTITDSEPMSTITDSEPMSTTTDPETELPAGETPAANCPYCDRPFDGKRARDLHVGEHHAGEATQVELDAYDEAREAERDELFMYHVKVVVALGVIYSVVVLVYMAALGSGFV
ncbi:MAG: hypothetical protein ABEH66_06090 [Halobacteriales archaeon]